MKKTDVHIGTAGFNNGYWKGIFYPETLPKSKWFAFYCEHFPMYEMNGTFYKFPTVKTLRNWYDKSPNPYKFVVKAPRTITHFKKFKDCDTELAEFYTACKEGLAKKLYALLFQLPPSFHYTTERLTLILSALSTDFLTIIEFRHASWWIPEVYEALAKSKFIFCSVSFPNLPQKVIQTHETGYVRMHGRTKLFYSGYSDHELQALYEEIVSKDFQQAIVCFNNTASEFGILNALKMKTLSE